MKRMIIGAVLLRVGDPQARGTEGLKAAENLAFQGLGLIPSTAHQIVPCGTVSLTSVHPAMLILRPLINIRSCLISKIKFASRAEARSMKERSLREVDPPTLKAWLDRGEALLVDVREEDEHARERIAGARLLPLSRFDESRVPHEPGKVLVLQCRSGNRSAQAARRIDGPLGADLYHLAGGIEAWKQAGLPVESRSAERTAAAA